MNEYYYLVKYKWGPGGIGFIVYVNKDKSKIIVGKGHINKSSELELKVKEGRIISISENYSFKKIDKDRAESLQRKEEKHIYILAKK